jgi:hypothetical protein
VIDVVAEDAPPAVELSAVGAAVPGAAPVVHDDGEATAGEELGAQLEPEGGVAGRAGMGLQDQRGALLGCPGDGAWLVGGW